MAPLMCKHAGWTGRPSAGGGPHRHLPCTLGRDLNVTTN